MNGHFGEIAPWRVILAGTVLLGLVWFTLRGVGSSRRLAVSYGKWLAVAIGLAIGQAGLGLLGERELASVRPLAGILLTWIGLIVGLQLAGAALRRVPAVLLRWSLLDGILCVLASLATVWLLWFRLDVDPWSASSMMAAILVGTACLGWSPETRSLGLGHDRESQSLATLVRAGAGLQAAVATLVFGVSATVTDFGADGHLRFEGWWGIVLLATAACTSVLVAIGAWLLLERITRGPGERLVVTLGAIAVLAGTAEWLHTTPLFTGFTCGAVLANLRGRGLDSLAVRLKEAELSLGVALFLLAGLLLGPVDVPLLAGLVGICLLVRMACKPAATALARLPLRTAGRRVRRAARQPAPLATAIVAGGVLLRDSQLRRTVLAAILLGGLVVFLLQFLPARGARRHGGAA